MIKTYKLNRETWVDIDNGTPEEIHSVMDKYGIHPFVAKELFSSTPKPRIEFHDQYIYCILHFPASKHTHSKDKNQEVDFIIGKDTLITARYDTIDALHKLGKDLEVEEVLDKGNHIYNHSHIIFTRLLRGLYTGVFEELEYIEDTIENITSNIFKKKEREMVVSISEITRTLLDFKRVTDLHQEILEALKERGQEIFGNEFANEMEVIILDFLKINTTIKSNLEMLRELRETDYSLLSAKQNEKLSQWTIIGSVLLILGIIATIATIFF
ncbi:MAG: Magnesium and cobalt transport protein CorA [Parcubacteria group bacterium GW2011_GWF2_39_8b]|nr:MAG: Magnesium and cobalt transport protein CorA [Parcubacteria group bacterium GW2011_GWF2_39_8b]